MRPVPEYRVVLLPHQQTSLLLEDELAENYKRATDNKVGYRSLQYFAEEDLQSALPYFIKSGAISIAGKGFTTLKVFKEITNNELQSVVNSSRTGMVIPLLKKPHFDKNDCRDFFNIFYSAIVSENARLKKNLDKCLIIEAHNKELNDNQKQLIETETEEKRNYKHDLLDYLVYLLDNYNSSKSLHQEIGRYLGVNKHLLGKIHQTESGDWVRSKSEVIIANILYRSKIPFAYEEKLFYAKGKWKEPDFTIHLDNKTWYWEHLGLLGDEDYNDDWQDKKRIYKDIGVLEKVITTKESAVLSNHANEVIKKIKSL